MYAQNKYIHTKPITQIDLKCLCHAHKFMKANIINPFAEIHDIMIYTFKKPLCYTSLRER